MTSPSINKMALIAVLSKKRASKSEAKKLRVKIIFKTKREGIAFSQEEISEPTLQRQEIHESGHQIFNRNLSHLQGLS